MEMRADIRCGGSSSEIAMLDLLGFREDSGLPTEFGILAFLRA